MSDSSSPIPAAGDALLLVDLQNDFLPGGALAVPHGDEVLPVLAAWVRAFATADLPVAATRDWHPRSHCSFRAQGGPWPPHCVARTRGAAFAEGFALPPETLVVSKGEHPALEAYSGFAGTALADELREAGVRRLFVGGLATDYCVLQTVLDALGQGFEVFVLRDGVRAVDVHAGDGEAALARMRAQGARLVEGVPAAPAPADA
jgi:nicotinamidase/pyrazinamidase